MRKLVLRSAVGIGGVVAAMLTAPVAEANALGDIAVTQTDGHGVPVAVADVVEVNEPVGHCESQQIAATATGVTVMNLTTTPQLVGLADACPTGSALRAEPLRVINTSGLSHFTFSIDEHPLRIIEVEGENMRPRP